jgi:hypothetical protein
MKIDAGFELYTRKPISAAASAPSMAASAGRPLRTNPIARKIAAVADTPAARPSMLSRRLIAFVMPTSQKNVIATFTVAHAVHGSDSPA